MRVGVIGLGFAAHVHVPALRACPDVEVAAIAGSTAERAAAVAARLGIPAACGGYRDLLGRDDLDAVTLALPPSINGDALALALERRMPVLSEKPASSSGARTAQLAAQAEGITTAMDFLFAELETFAELHSMVRSGVLGRLRSIHVTWTVQSYAQRERKWGWKTDARRGGGVLTLLGSHVLFLVEWLVGPVELVSIETSHAATSRFAPAGASPAEDTVKATLRTADGLCIDALLSNALPRPALHRWVVEGDAATAVLENSSADYIAGFRLSRQTPGATPTLVRQEPLLAGDNRVAAVIPLMQRFIAGVRSGAMVQPDLTTAARVDELIDRLRCAV